MPDPGEPGTPLDPDEWREGAHVAELYLEQFGRVPDRYLPYLPPDRRAGLPDDLGRASGSGPPFEDTP